MRNLISCLVILGLAFLHLHAQTSVRTLDVYGGVVHVPDQAVPGGYLMVGRQLNTYTPAILRLDAAGQLLSSVAVDPSLNLGVTGISPLTGGGYALCGFDIDTPNTTMVMRLDNSGQPISFRVNIREQNRASWLGIAATPDGGAVVVGNDFDDASNIFTLVAKLDAQLDTVWTRVLPNATGVLTGKHVAVLPSGNLIVAGERASLGNGDYKLCVHKLTAAGDWVWSKHYFIGGGWVQIVNGLVYDGQDRLSIAAVLENPSGTRSYISHTVLDTAGNFVRMDTVTSNTFYQVRGVGVGHNGEFLLAGSYLDVNSNQVGYNLAISATDSLLWANRYERGDGDFLLHVQRLPNGGYLWSGGTFVSSYLLQSDAQGAVADNCGTTPLNLQMGSINASTVSFQPGLYAGLFDRVYALTYSPFAVNNQLQCFTTGAPGPVQGQRPQVYPQPMQSSAHIDLPGFALDQDAQLSLYDMAGRLLLPPSTRTQDGWLIQRGGLPAGLYSYQALQGGQRIASGKLWIAD